MRILIVDDEPNLRRMLRVILEEEGYRVEEAASAERAIGLVRDAPPEAVLLDLALPGMSGLEALPRLQDVIPGTPIVMMSGQASLSDAVQATRKGAFHFLEKPLSAEAVLATVRAALEVSRARSLTRTLRDEVGADGRLVGASRPMSEVRDTIRKVGPTDARVLITGESGTGKELAAAAIHELSKRRDGPFLRVNSAALPRELVESEMFGHEKGAFTGATDRHRGRFELADRGTLFLDEVGDLGDGAQAKLLRTLETGVIQRVGAQDEISVDVRVLAATNRDLRRSVEEGAFREDLLYRLEVVVLRMPTLRERPEDVTALVEHAGERLRTSQGLLAPTLSDEALELLRAHDWPGNVRELLNLMERLAIFHSGEEVGTDEVSALLSPRSAPDYPAGKSPEEGSLRERLDRHEIQLIRGAIREADGNIAEAARRLETDRSNLYRRMKRLGIRPDEV